MLTKVFNPIFYESSTEQKLSFPPKIWAPSSGGFEGQADAARNYRYSTQIYQVFTFRESSLLVITNIRKLVWIMCCISTATPQNRSLHMRLTCFDHFDEFHAFTELSEKNT